jgi:thiol-disulfide isomerase/thioredoxin
MGIFRTLHKRLIKANLKLIKYKTLQYFYNAVIVSLPNHKKSFLTKMHDPCILVFLLLHCLQALPQATSIKATVKGLPGSKVYLQNYFAGRNTIIDSATADKNETFQFAPVQPYACGLYRIILGKDNKALMYGGDDTYLDVIINGENIDLHTYFYAPVDSMKILSSAENRIYYDFLQRDKKVNEQLEILTELQIYFPKTDAFYTDIREHYNSTQQQHQQYVLKVMAGDGQRFAAHLINAMHYPPIDFSLSDSERQQYIKVHFFDNIDFTDTLLLRTDIFTSRALAYLLFYKDPSLTKEQQENEFIRAVDTLLGKTSVNPKVSKLVRDYIVRGFEMAGMENVLIHIASTYILENACEDDQQARNLRMRVDGMKKLAIGTTAPEISITDGHLQQFILSDVKSPYTLLIFWASWCPHCMAMLPELKKLYDGQAEKKLEIVAISIDTSYTDYSRAVAAGGYNWISISDGQGWDGQPVTDYCIYATPTMFLLNADKKIIAKPMTPEEIRSSVR